MEISDKSREQFEEWFNPTKERMKKDGLGLIAISRLHQRQWEGWQASRQCIEVEFPANQPECFGFMAEHFNSTLEECAKSILAAGIKIKWA